MVDIFGNDGVLKKFLDNYEDRDEQLRMSDFILECLYENKNALVEAGTGVGKTIAYLVPAVIYCIENNKKLAVSTETKALQKQLINKDLPLVKNLISKCRLKEFKYSLCLGSANYPCRKRFEIMLRGGRLAKSDIKTAEYLNELFNSGEIFSRLDVRVPARIWNEISREPDVCGYFNCPFSSLCVFQKAKKSWMNSHVLVMNHYLFYANMASGKAYLPKFDIIIFDEAHSIEEIASDQLGFDISRDQAMESLNRLHSGRRKKSLLSQINDSTKRDRALTVINDVKTEVSGFFESARSLFRQGQNSLRLREKISSGNSLLNALKALLSELERAEALLPDEFLKVELDVLRGRIFLFQQSLESILHLQNPNFVYWLEKKEDELLGDIHLLGRPVNVSEIMRDEINTFYDSSIFVSATLTANGEFSYITDRLGIQDYKTLLLSSPFNYKEQVVLYLGSETASPDKPGYTDHVIKTSAEIVNYTGGNCLFLFTSYAMLETVKKGLAAILPCNIYAQGDYPASETVEHYINDSGSILMGTHSFWQGIDLPGDLLRGVILMRLPFSVPDRPLVQARIELMQQAGLNPFLNYQIPGAIIRFKQGFGRLIRSSTDTGIVAVLDSRIVSKNYGKLFLNSLPECRIITDLKQLKPRAVTV